MWNLEQRYNLVFAGRYDQAGVEPPQLEHYDRILVVQRLRDLGRQPRLIYDPGILKVPLGIELAGRKVRGVYDACCGRYGIIEAGGDERRWYQNCAHALTHLGFHREGWQYAEADIILATGEWALPTRMALAISNPARAVELQPYATDWLVRLQWWRARTPWGCAHIPAAWWHRGIRLAA